MHQHDGDRLATGDMTPGQGQESALVERAQVARIEPAGGECVAGGLRVSPVVAEQVRPAELDRADRARPGGRAVVPDHADLDALERHADGALGPGPIRAAGS